MNRIGEYTPRIIGEDFSGIQAEILIELKRCASCKKPMLPHGKWRLPWPAAFDNDLFAQANRAGWSVLSRVIDKEGEPICQGCASEDKATILCVLCEVERPSSALQQAFGNPPENLCKFCYETVPARIWYKKVDELDELHRWDFE